MTKPHHTKPDANHAACLEAARAAGWTCDDTHDLGGNFLDFDAAKHGVYIRVEVKSDRRAPLTDREWRVVYNWPGLAITVYDPQDCVSKLAVYYNALRDVMFTPLA